MNLSGSAIRVAIALGTLLLLTAIALSGCRAERENLEAPLYEAPPENAERVLFLGNSHTFYNNLPGMLERLAHFEEGARPIVTTSIAVGGASLNDHLANPGVLQNLSAPDRFDTAIIQGASLEPIISPGDFVTAFQQLERRAQSSEIRTILYEIWPRGPGDDFYRAPGNPTTPEHAFRLIREASERALRDTAAELAPVAQAWERSRRTATPIALYLDDQNHATVAGTYLAALVLYGTLRGSPLSDSLWHPEALSQSDAAALRAIADHVLAEPSP